MIIETTLGPLDESLLIKREGSIDNENECTTTTEYCLKGCTGHAHITGIAYSDLYFCPQHVHRSVHVALKRTEGLQSALGSLQ